MSINNVKTPITLINKNSNNNSDLVADPNSTLMNQEEVQQHPNLFEIKENSTTTTNKNLNNKEEENFENSASPLHNQNIKYTLGYRENNGSLLYNNFINNTGKGNNEKNNIVGNSSNNNLINIGVTHQKKLSKNNFIVEKLQDFKDNLINKLKLLILEEHSNTPHYIIFNSIIFLVNLVNFICLLTIHHPMQSEDISKIVLVNVVCSGIFVIEIIFKILVLGRSYFKDLMNVLDFFVIFAGITEIIVTNLTENPDGNMNF